MTALSEYQRLECTGLWRDMPEAQRRAVIVSFGDATLVISDERSARVLAHWSLPAVVRRNPGTRPALYAPAPEAREELEIEDETMIAAIAKVHRLIEARRPHPGRLRRALLGGGLVAILAALVLVLPGALIEHTVGVLPPAKRAEIGHMALADLTRLSGQPCAGAEGMAALERLSTRVLGPGAGRLAVLPEGLEATRHLPGGLILIGAPLLSDATGAEGLARAILIEDWRAGQSDPLPPALRHAGLAATFRLLTTGELSAGALRDYGAAVLAEKPAAPDPADLARLLREAGLAPAAPGGPPPAPVLADNDWVALQDICRDQGM